MMEIRKRPGYVYLNIHLSLPVCIGSEKPQWGVANYIYILRIQFKGCRNVSHQQQSSLFRTTLSRTNTLYELLILLGPNHLLQFKLLLA